MKYLKQWGGKNTPTEILYPTRLSTKSEGEIKTFSDKQKLRQFVGSRPAARNVKSPLERRKIIRRNLDPHKERALVKNIKRSTLKKEREKVK